MIFIVSGPGGAGKGTIVKELVARDPTLWLSRSWTTRPQRVGEPSDAYEFKTEEEFRRKIADDGFLEWVDFLGSLYGTPNPDPPEGLDLLLEIELEGAQKVRGKLPEAILVLVVPPSIDVQRERLRGRGESDDRIEQRVTKGQLEMIEGERIANEILVNDDLETAVQALADIVAKYRQQEAGSSQDLEDEIRLAAQEGRDG